MQIGSVQGQGRSDVEYTSSYMQNNILNAILLVKNGLLQSAPE